MFPQYLPGRSHDRDDSNSEGSPLPFQIVIPPFLALLRSDDSDPSKDQETETSSQSAEHQNTEAEHSSPRGYSNFQK